jgi:hypothetical protein
VKSPWKTLACAGLALSLVSCATGSGSDPGRAHAVVQFSYAAVKPETVRIPTDGTVTWINVAADSRGVIVFPASTSSGSTCGENLRPDFQEVSGAYQSRPIEHFESAPVQLPCPLEPGTYPYEIWLRGTGLGETIVEGPERKLRATIVVGD